MGQTKDTAGWSEEDLAKEKEEKQGHEARLMPARAGAGRSPDDLFQSKTLIEQDRVVRGGRVPYFQLSQLKIAMFGASGTGKTTLAEALHRELGLPINPVGSRSVAQAMGFASPYDVDKADRRKEFQHLLAHEKYDWERLLNNGFITDRTGADNYAYSVLAGATPLMELLVDTCKLYTHIFHLPMTKFHFLGGDRSRKDDRDYHQRSESLMTAFMNVNGISYYTLNCRVEDRTTEALRILLGAWV